jgi:L-iditol 2-dehydrogenase
MKAAVYHGIEDIRIEEIDTPDCKPDQLMIKVAYCAICGTDVRIYFHGHKKVKPPAIIGHEITGTVSEIGSKVNCPDIKKGDKVTVVTSIGEGKCKMCSKGFYNLCPENNPIGYFYQGGFAEYLPVPEKAVQQKAVIKLPDNVSLKEGSLIEPLSCCINGQSYLNITQGDTVVIFGGGPIGLMHASLAKAAGADRVIVTDPAFDRLENFGRKFNFLTLIDPRKKDIKQEVDKLTEGFGADVVITACPSKQAQMQGFQLLGSKGRISLFGGLPKDDSVIEMDANLIHYKELSVFGSFASNKKDFLKAAELISSGKIRPTDFISEVLPLEKITEGINMVKRGEVLKAVLEVDKTQDETSL